MLGMGRHLDLDRFALPALPPVLARGASERVRESADTRSEREWSRT